MTVKERLIEYIKFKNISQSIFEKKVGLSNGYVNNINKGISDEYLQKIALVFDDLNLVWLRMGEGNMLKNINSETEN
jgi:transcriptional regulator with XRE-family HTH domain